MVTPVVLELGGRDRGGGFWDFWPAGIAELGSFRFRERERDLVSKYKTEMSNDREACPPLSASVCICTRVGELMQACTKWQRPEIMKAAIMTEWRGWTSRLTEVTHIRTSVVCSVSMMSTQAEHTGLGHPPISHEIKRIGFQRDERQV